MPYLVLGLGLLIIFSSDFGKALKDMGFKVVFDKNGIIKDIHNIFGCTILFVTHDFNEAQRMANRIGIMVKGELNSIRKSEDLFKSCDDEEVNKFLGLQGGSNSN